jgi:hypothetical protein
LKTDNLLKGKYLAELTQGECRGWLYGGRGDEELMGGRVDCGSGAEQVSGVGVAVIHLWPVSVTRRTTLLCREVGTVADTQPPQQPERMGQTR